MKKASISEAKNTLSALLDRVKRGATVLIVDRGRPVARLEPIGDGAGSDGRLAQLVREGLARPPRGPLPPDVFTAPPHARAGRLTPLDAVLDERASGR
jgi:prevent-host-death family protein